MKAAVLLLATGLLSACAHRTVPLEQPAAPEAAAATPRFYTLNSDAVWQLDFAESPRFDASGLLWHGGRLLTINDRNSDLFEIELGQPPASKILPTGLFPPEQVRAAAPEPLPRFDSEGIASDAAGRLYICEEAARAVYRWDPRTERIERLSIDFAPAAHALSKSINASFEGIAIGGDRLYLANERNKPLLIVVNLETLEVVDHFTVYPGGFALGGPHYSDLSWHAGHLYILDRNHRSVVQVDPRSKEIVAQFSFAAMEQGDEFAYRTDFPTGTMEGLAVSDEYFWLVTDNNGRGRQKYPDDLRPTLFRCPRPDRR